MRTQGEASRGLARRLGTALVLAGAAGAAWWGIGTALGQGASGSVEAGRQVFERQCARCHGDALQGMGRSPPLVGRQTVPDYPNAWVLYQYIRRSMPLNAPGTLSDEDALSAVAFLLNQNGLLADDAVLEVAMLRSLILPGADPIAPPLPNAPETPQEVTPGSSQDGPVAPPRP